MNGKLSTFPMKKKAEDIFIKDLDCPNVMPDIAIEETVEDNKDLEDEILKEILKEDEERRKRQAKEEAEFKKKKGDKKKKKSKPKKGRDDL